ncbi:crotonase/enoyl-CoA hydratase family protein [Pseudooceanicola sp.]|uniref:crotonase/enoyl-CoA hydratase family protein n=1 Tax=Pseudooceanicola sp. TaxID=1914328 RepID=UPI0026324869|nr:crotonase/enoyl-CoA hydratase family protein [Pseudooceanicola sp.]MDF1856166.1 crotonase/enoyl-CoA hydratase family protein [Pseudooceanicola sp.]
MPSDQSKDPERHPDGQITVERRGDILLMGIDRREKRNSLTPRMFGQLQDAFCELDENPDLRAGIVFGHAGHFTAGLDLVQTSALRKQGKYHLDKNRVDPYARWRRCRKPVIAAVQGITFTAGIELMLGADIVIAADDCRFAQIEAKRGIIPGGGAIQRFIERAGYGNAMLLLLPTPEFGSDDALRMGLVQQVVPAGQELDRAIEIAEAIGKNAPLAIQAILEAGRVYQRNGEAAAIDWIEAQQREIAFTKDAAEGVAAFKDKREPKFTGE